jgi:hypothetical protein
MSTKANIKSTDIDVGKSLPIMRMSVTGWQQLKRKTSKKATCQQHNFKTG